MTVLIADDDLAFRDFLRHILTRERGFKVVAEASDVQEALQATEKTNPDVVLMDFDLPIRDGLLACRTIKASLPGTRVVVISEFEGETYRRASQKYGADAFIPKGAEVSLILATIAGQA